MTMWKPQTDESGPRYIAIADAIERDVAGGVLTEGTKLPTHRELAKTLGVTVGTVSRGYAEAERRGLTTGEVGRGTFVRPTPDSEVFGWREAGQEGVKSGVIDMSLACPWIPPDGEEGRLLAKTLTEVAQSQPLDELMAYHASSALPRHRAVAADWLSRLGVQVSPDRLVVTNGAQHAMTVILAALMRPGDTLLTAELTYPGLKAVAQMLGLKMQGVAMDNEGIMPESLDAICEQSPAQALYCVPSMQNPTGATMSEERRRAIAEVARRHSLFIVEDQVQIGTDAQRIPPIVAFAPERTVHITTLSKWVTFGLRIGFVAAPEVALERILSGVRSTLWMPAPLMTEIATRWIVDGTAERLAQRQIEELEARHEIVREVLGHHRVDCPPGSLHTWVHLPEPMRSDECVAQARQRGVAIAGAEAFAVGRDVPHAVRVSIAQVPHRKDVRRGLEILADILDGASEACVQIV
jgi:DNA-binding transcriptional MocR family regulator